MPTPIVLSPPPTTAEEPDIEIEAEEYGAPKRKRTLSFHPSSSDIMRGRSPLSRNDISASPRLANYFICFTASVVCLVSVMMYNDNTRTVIAIQLNIVKDWKITGALVAGAGGTGMTGAIMCAHFEKRFFPDFWRAIFQDGSRWELGLIVLLLLFWTAGVYLCSSPFSVGEVAINVLFSSWIAFASALRLLEAWRRDAGFPTFTEYLKNHPNKTTQHWAWILFFSIVIFASAVELFTQRNNDVIYFGVGNLSMVDNGTWVEWLAVSSAVLGLSIVGLLLNMYKTEPWNVTVTCCSFRLDWQQLEGLSLLALIGLNTYSVVTYTGIDSFINSPSNPYFSIWGLYFSSVVGFSAWLGQHDFLILSYKKGEGIKMFYTPGSSSLKKTSSPSPTNESPS